MAAISNTELSNTFDTWRINTNQTSNRLNAYTANTTHFQISTLTVNTAISIPAGSFDSNTYFADDVITTHAVADGAISSNTQIADGIIGAAELSTNSVTTAKIVANAVTSAKIASGAISSNTQIADGIIGAAELSSNSVVAGKIAAGAVSSNAALAASVITGHAIAASSVTIGKIAATSANNHTPLIAIGGGDVAFQYPNNVVTSTANTSLTLDFSTGSNFEVTLANNVTLLNPTNQSIGQGGIVRIIQDATGSRTVAYGNNWVFESGTAPTATTTASAVDILVYQVTGTAEITSRLITNVS